MKSFTLLICLFLVTYVCAQTTPVSISEAFFGLAGNGTVYYQNVTNYFSFPGNVQNPIDVSISYQQNVFNFEASICLNYNGYPINGAILESSCPSGGFGTASNTTSFLVPPQGNQLSKTQYSSLKSRFIGNKMAMASSPLPEGTTTETTVAKVYVKPGRLGGFIVTVPDSVDPVYFYVGYSALTCNATDLYPIGNGTCETIGVAAVGPQTAQNIGSKGWAYYQYTVDPTTVSSFSVSINGSKDDVELFVQSGYYPTSDWFINTSNEDDNDIHTATIYNPGSIYITNATETFFFGIYNGNKNAQSVQLNLTLASCAAPAFGFNCTHTTANTSDPIAGYATLSATLKPGTNGSQNTFTYDYTDKDTYNEDDYAYFMLSDYPTTADQGYEDLSYPYYIRVTVANNDVSEYAPGFFAKQGGFPSAQSATYNLSTPTDVSHQIVIQVNDPSEDPAGVPGPTAWFFAVALRNDFSIWVGINCANDCDSDKHGECMCGTVTCNNATANGTNLVAYYTLPNTTVDSSGSCTCSDDDYDYSFDCAQKNNGNAALYIVLIAVGGMIVLAVAIGVPIYCYISNKKATRYDRM